MHRVSLLLGWVWVLGCSSSTEAALDTGSDDGAVETLVESGAEETIAETGTPDAVDAGGPADAGDPKKDVAAFAKAWAEAACAKLSECCSDADVGSFFASYQAAPYTLPAGKVPSAAECVATLTTQLGVLHGKWLPSIERGRMAFDAKKGAACVAAISKASCGTDLSTALLDPKCSDVRATEVFTKTAKVGTPCQDIGDTTFNGECDPTQGYCDGPPSKVTDRKCVAWRKPGEQCSAVPLWWFCDTRNGSSCDGASPSKPGTCSRLGKKLALGAACGQDTGPIDECDVGTYCDDATKKCTATKADGEACHWNYECKSAWPYSCAPFDPVGAGGKCGSKAFCNGKAGK